MKPIPLHKFDIRVPIDLSIIDLNTAREKLNLHFFNDTVCNHIVDGNMVPKYPEIEANNPQIQDAFYSVVRGGFATVTMNLMSDGTFRQQQ